MGFEGEAPWGEIAGFTMTLIVLISLITFMAVGVVFSVGKRKLIGTILAVLVPVGSLVAHLALEKIVEGNEALRSSGKTPSIRDYANVAKQGL